MIIIYHHSYRTRLHLFLSTMRLNIAHLYWCHKQWSLSTTAVPAYIYFNVPGCYYFSSIFAHRPEVHRSANSSAVGLDALHCEQCKFCCRPRSVVGLNVLHCEQCSSFVNNSPAFSVHRSSTIRQSSTIPDAAIDWCWSNTPPRLHAFLIDVHRSAVWPFAHCTVQWLRLRLALHSCDARRSSTTTSRNILTFIRLHSCLLVICLLLHNFLGILFA